MSEEPKPEPVAHPCLLYVLGSIILWAVAASPLIDWLSGDWEGYWRAFGKGVPMGLLFGLVMYPFERWLKRREARKKAAGSPPPVQGPQAGDR